VGVGAVVGNHYPETSFEDMLADQNADR